MLVKSTGLNVQMFANAINFMQDGHMPMQLIVKKYELPDGKSGVCLYSTHEDGSEYFIRSQKPTVNITKNGDKPVVLIDCNASKFNIAIECNTDEEAAIYMNKLTAAVNNLWKYRITKIREFMKGTTSTPTTPKTTNAVTKSEVPHEDEGTDELSNVVVDGTTMPKELMGQLRKLKKLMRNGRLLTEGSPIELLSVSGSNCINSLIEFYNSAMKITE